MLWEECFCFALSVILDDYNNGNQIIFSSILHTPAAQLPSKSPITTSVSDHRIVRGMISLVLWRQEDVQTGMIKRAKEILFFTLDLLILCHKKAEMISEKQFGKVHKNREFIRIQD